MTSLILHCAAQVGPSTCHRLNHPVLGRHQAPGPLLLCLHCVCPTPLLHRGPIGTSWCPVPSKESGTNQGCPGLGVWASPRGWEGASNSDPREERGRRRQRWGEEGGRGCLREWQGVSSRECSRAGRPETLSLKKEGTIEGNQECQGTAWGAPWVPGGHVSGRQDGMGAWGLDLPDARQAGRLQGAVQRWFPPLSGGPASASQSLRPWTRKVWLLPLLLASGSGSR